MVTLAEPKQTNVADNRPDGSQAPAETPESIPQSQYAFATPVFETVVVNPGKTRMARLSGGITEIYDWLMGPPTTHKQRIALEVAEINESRAARVMAFDF
jgi:hypothetical protein